MHGWGSRIPQGLLLGPLGPRFQGIGCTTLPNSLNGHILELWFYELPFIVNDHGSRRTWGPGPSGSRFGVQTDDLPSLNVGALQILLNKVFSKTEGWGSRGTPPPPLYAPHTPEGGTQLTPQEPSHPQGPPLRQISSRSIWWFGCLWRTDIQTYKTLPFI